MRKDTTYIYGKHAVKEALLHMPHIFYRVMFQSGAEAKQEMYQYVKDQEIKCESYDSRHMPKGVPKDAVHQGVIAEIYQEGIMKDYDDFIKTLDMNKKPGLLVLGEVQDLSLIHI